MVIKKDMKAWAVKLRGRSFYQGTDGNPFLYTTKLDASSVAMRMALEQAITAEPIRVRVRIEEIE
jgi:hypothetical protein